MKKIKNIWRSLNPKHLQKEIYAYGYHYSLRNHVLVVAGICVGLLILGRFLGLEYMYICTLIMVFLVTLHCNVKNIYIHLHEQKKFIDVSNYIEQLLYSFKRHSKILSALEDTLLLYPEGVMHDKIVEMIAYLQYAEDSENIYEHAFTIVEEVYGCEMIHKVHRFVTNVELYGGTYEDSADILISDRNKWVNRVIEAQEQKNAVVRNMTISVILAMGIVGIMGIVVPEEFSYIRSSTIAQVSTWLTIVANYLTWLHVSCRLSGSWIEMDKPLTQVEAEKLQKSKRARRRLKREVEKAFPEWLLSIALLLQTDNVQVGIRKSIPDAPIILQKELRILMEKVEENPIDIWPYLEFYEALKIEDIQSTMKMLYAMSQYGSEDIGKQIYALVERNSFMQDRSEKMKMEDYLAGVGVFVLLPMLIGSLKLMVDMGLLIIGLLSQTQGIM